MFDSVNIYIFVVNKILALNLIHARISHTNKRAAFYLLTYILFCFSKPRVLTNNLCKVHFKEFIDEHFII